MAQKIEVVIDGKNKASPAILEVNKHLGSLSETAKRAGAALVGYLSVDAFAGWIKGAADLATEMSRMATLSNTSVETFSGWAYAARSVGIEQDKLGDIFKDVQDKVGDFLSTGGGEMKDFFTNVAPLVGVTAEQFRTLSGPDALQLYVSSLEKAGLSQAELVFYMEALADDASLLLPLLGDNAKGLKRLTDEAQRLGLIVNGDTAAGARAFNDQLRTLETVSGSAGQQIAAEMLPAMTEITGLFVDYAKDGQAVGTVSSAIGAAMKVLATVVIVVGDSFAQLGRGIGAVAAASVAAAKGDFSEAGQILREVTADNEQATRDAEARIKKLWSGAYAETGAAAAKVQADLEKTNQNLTGGVVRTNEQLTDSYKKLAADAKAALSDLASAEKDALSTVEKIRADRLAIEQRYSQAIAGLKGGDSAAPSYSAAQELKIGARQALQAGDIEGAQQQAKAALEMLQELAKAGQNTYGFAGFAEELKQIELGANDLQQSQADTKLAEIRTQLDSLKASAASLEAIQITPTMREEDLAALKTQMEQLAAQLGQTLTIPVTVGAVSTPDAAPTATPGFATGGYISGPGSGTSDSILARLSNGEYVMRAAAVRQYGTGFLDMLNGLHLPKYADGGLVGNISPAPPASLGTVNLSLDGQRYSLQAGPDVFAEMHKARLKYGRTHP